MLCARLGGLCTDNMNMVPYGESSCPRSLKSSDGSASLPILEIGCTIETKALLVVYVDDLLMIAFPSHEKELWKAIERLVNFDE